MSTPKLTAQQIFDRICDMFTGPAAAPPSRNEKGMACYQTTDGKKCFAGALMTDQERAEFMGDDDLRPWQVDYAWEIYGLLPSCCPKNYPPRSAAKFVAGLQTIHDEFEPAEWPEALRRYAKLWELDGSRVRDHAGTSG